MKAPGGKSLREKAHLIKYTIIKFEIKWGHDKGKRHKNKRKATGNSKGTEMVYEEENIIMIHSFTQHEWYLINVIHFRIPQETKFLTTVITEYSVNGIHLIKVTSLKFLVRRGEESWRWIRDADVVILQSEDWKDCNWEEKKWRCSNSKFKILRRN